jgi:hypothetical protein
VIYNDNEDPIETVIMSYKYIRLYLLSSSTGMASLDFVVTVGENDFLLLVLACSQTKNHALQGNSRSVT